MRRVSPGLMALALAALAVAPAARAADMAPAPGYYPPPVVYRPAIYNWSGLYLGGNVGVGILTDTVTQTSATVPPFQPAGNIIHDTAAGFLGGAQFGGNYQFGSWVVGVEAMFDWSNISASVNSPTIAIVVPKVGPITERSTSAQMRHIVIAAVTTISGLLTLMIASNVSNVRKSSLPIPNAMHRTIK